MKYCPKCGKTFSDRINYCEACGSPLYVKQFAVGSSTVTDNYISTKVKTFGLTGAVCVVLASFLPIYREKYSTFLYRVDETYTLSSISWYFVPILLMMVGIVMYSMFMNQRKNYLIYNMLLCIFLVIILSAFGVMFSAVEEFKTSIGFYFLIAGLFLMILSEIELIRQ